MRIVLTDIQGGEYEPEDISEITLDESSDAVCSALSLRCAPVKNNADLHKIRAYDGKRLIFNGFVDLTRESFTKGGSELYIYARSSASLLLDNEAFAYTFRNPTAVSLFNAYARELGFEHNLPEVSCEALYEVQKGSSCFGAVNSFVRLITGKSLYVTPENVLKPLESDGKIVDGDMLDCVSEVRTTDRSDALSLIKYKREQGEKDYSVNACALVSEELKLNRRKYINLGLTPEWQRDFTVLDTLKRSFEKYKTLELTVEGFAEYGLMTEFSYTVSGVRERYLLYAKRYTFSGDGEKTKLRLARKTDLKEIVYVD